MDVVCSFKLASMSPKLQKQHEYKDTPTIPFLLQMLYEEQNKTKDMRYSSPCFVAEWLRVLQLYKMS